MTPRDEIWDDYAVRNEILNIIARDIARFPPSDEWMYDPWARIPIPEVKWPQKAGNC